MSDGPSTNEPENPGTSQVRASGHRGRELEWRKTHGEVLRTFVGQWVVLEKDEVIAHGRDPAKVIAEARAKGVRVPYIFYVEGRAEDVVGMGL